MRAWLSFWFLQCVCLSLRKIRGSRKQLVTHTDLAGIIPYPLVLKHRYDEDFILADETLAELLLLKRVRELVIAALF